MSTVRSIERRLYVRRQADREVASQVAAVGAEAPRTLGWGGVWAGYMIFAGTAVLLLSFVFAIGFSSLDPLSASSWSAVGTRVVAWSGIAALVATFLGAWVAAQTPRASRFHGMLRGLTLWGMIVLTVVGLALFVGTAAVSAGASVAGGAIGAAAPMSSTALRGMLQSNGVVVTPSQADSISSQLMAGNRNGAAATLSTDAGVSMDRADALLGEASSSLAGAATTTTRGLSSAGGGLSWGLFWISLLGLVCALAGGLAGGSAIGRRYLPLVGVR